MHWTILRVLAFLAVSALALFAEPQAQIAYFTNLREVRVAAPARQNYVVLDEDVWRHAEHSAADLRLFDGDREVPYALRVQRGGSPVQLAEAKVLNAGRANGETEFVLDMRGVPEYNQVTLRLAESARNFISRARVEGLNRPDQGGGIDLGSTTLFDFSRERLGNNFTLKLRPAVFAYLRVRLPEIAPEQVLGATVADSRTRAADWTPVLGSPRIELSGRTTIVTWRNDGEAPVARVAFNIDPAQINFRRSVQLQSPSGEIIDTAEISRIHLRRAGDTVDSETLAIELPQERWQEIKAVIQNGDDAPLRIASAQAYAYEQRVYFDPRGSAALKLYYGDPQLAAPVYDYAKLFQGEENAPRSTLGPDQRNPAYTGRPDQRPWSERHPLVLWTALAVAVLGLGAVALRGLAGSRTPAS